MRKRLQTSIVLLLASSLLQVMVTPMCAAADTQNYWRFEDGPGFLEDSVGGATLRAQNFDQVPLPSDGRGQNFPHDLPGIGSNESAADTPPGTAGLTSSRTTRINDAFTIELFANIDDLSIDSLRSVLAAQATNCCSPSNFGWAFTVEIVGTNHDQFGAWWQSRPHELELFASDGQSIHLIPSGILINENTDYFLSASFDIDDKVRFHVVDLDAGSEQTSEVAHSLNRLHEDPYFQIGAPYPQLSLDGLIDEVRLSHGVVPIEKLLVNLADDVDPLGDFDGNGVLNADDIDLLALEVRRATSLSSFDLNGDAIVDSNDLRVFVHDLRQTYFGDANLDGEFNSSDLVAVFEAGEYEDNLAGNSTWATGDWDGDGDFSSSDLVAAFQDGGYEQGPREAVASVPEPSSCLLIISGLLLLARRQAH
jgi:hypothetical protein